MAETQPRHPQSPEGPSRRRPEGRRRPPLWRVILAPFLVLLALQGAFTAWLSLETGQRAVEDVGGHLRHELTNRVRDYLRNLLEKPHLINALNADLLSHGLDPADPQALGRHFGHQLELFGTASYIFFGTDQGGAAGAGRREDGTPTVDQTPLDPVRGLVAGTRSEYTAGPDGLPGKLLESTPGFDARLRPWYVAAANAGEAAWSEVYPLFVDQSLAIAASRPVYDDTGHLLGVLGVDLRLSGLGEFLRQLEIGQTGETFVIERSGLLVASSVDETPLAPGRSGTELERRHGINSSSLQISGATRYLLHRVGDLGTLDREYQMSFKLAGVRQLLQVAPLRDGRGIDWLIVTVMPESDFTGPLVASRRKTLQSVLAAFVLATLLGIWTARWIAAPIRQLGNATQALAEGEAVAFEGDARVDEVDHLVSGFDHMAAQLRRSFSELERRVDERTAELALAKDTADRANRAKTRFLANVSHEIRTPLATILGTLELLGDRRLTASEREDALDSARRQGHHLSLLLADLIDIGRIEEGQFELDIAGLDLDELLDTLQTTFHDTAHAQGLVLDLGTHGRVPWQFEVDGRRLRQILFNLLSNALRYTREGQVSLHIAQAPQEAPQEGQTGGTDPEKAVLEFVVEDTGPGIPEDRRRQLFEPYTRLDDDAQGFGLGLAIVRQLGQQMGGTITLDSTLGQGSRFTLRLPVEGCSQWAEGPRVAGGGVGSRPAFASDLPPLDGRILVAEDSRALNQLCRRMLGRWGLRAEAASDGREAIDLATQGRFDAILMDWQMPHTNGLEATRELRRRGLRVPIIALTAAARPGDRDRCLAAGCDDHLGKPIDFRRLHRRLAALLAPRDVAHQDSTLREAAGHRDADHRGGEHDHSGQSEPHPSGLSGAVPSPANLVDDPELAELVARFLERLEPQIETLEGHLANHELDAARALCHRLVGSAGSFGLANVAAAAEALEALLSPTEPESSEANPPASEPPRLSVGLAHVEGEETESQGVAPQIVEPETVAPQTVEPRTIEPLVAELRNRLTEAWRELDRSPSTPDSMSSTQPRGATP